MIGGPAMGPGGASAVAGPANPAGTAGPEGGSPGIDPALFDHYVTELRHLRDGAAGFARAYPRVAARLGLDPEDEGQACPDPHVERLLEGVAFLTARVRHQIESGHPRFTGHLLERLLPHHAAPMPAVAIVALEPELDDPALAAGPAVPTGSLVCARRRAGEGRDCRFRTAHAVRLRPLRIAEARLRSRSTASGAAATLHLRIEVTAGLRCDQLDMDDVVLHACGEESLAHALQALMLRGVAGVDVCTPDEEGAVVECLPGAAWRPVGFEDDEALLPASARLAEGERLLKEYAACPARFLFMRIAGLRSALARMPGHAFALRVRLLHADATLERAVTAGCFALHATPVVNLHRRRADRVVVAAHETEFRVVPDRAHPDDHEIHSIVAVAGLDRSGTRVVRQFAPLHDPAAREGERRPAGYGLRRVARRRGVGARSSSDDEVVNEVLLSLSDPEHAPGAGDVAQLAVDAWCTDRDRPSRLPAGDATAWRLEAEAPVQRVRCLRAATPSLPPIAPGARTWALLAHLTAGLQGLLDPRRDEGAAAQMWREHLGLHATDPRSPLSRHVDGILGIRARAVVRRLPVPGPMVFGRGFDVTLTLDDTAFAGIGPVLLGAVLHRVLASRVPVGGFVEFTLVSSARGPIAHWGPRAGAIECA